MIDFVFVGFRPNRMLRGIAKKVIWDTRNHAIDVACSMCSSKWFEGSILFPPERDLRRDWFVPLFHEDCREDKYMAILYQWNPPTPVSSGLPRVVGP